MKKYLILPSFIALSPMIAFAASTGFAGVIETISNLIKLLVPVVISLAVLAFLWGLVGFMTKAGEEKENARNTMIYGIIILFVMVSIWGLVKLIQDTFGIKDSGMNIKNPVENIL